MAPYYLLLKVKTTWNVIQALWPATICKHPILYSQRLYYAKKCIDYIPPHLLKKLASIQDSVQILSLSYPISGVQK